VNESAGVVSLLDTWPAFSSFIYPSLGLESGRQLHSNT